MSERRLPIDAIRNLPIYRSPKKYLIYLQLYSKRYGSHQGWQRDALEHYNNSMSMDEQIQLHAECRRQYHIFQDESKTWQEEWAFLGYDKIDQARRMRSGFSDRLTMDDVEKGMAIFLAESE